MASRTMNCREVGRRIQSFLDGELDQKRLDGIRAHLDACVACGMEADVFRKIKAELAATAPEADPAVLDRLRQFSESIAARSAAPS